ncbi:hypothetical protein GTA08_BOTSDO13140 [Botryosphaeria dothidea]|uniref:Uncharacterized protein n=1 Tax=Botryosphaeria dothidea TaxID=55169 RepID=A0A8H4N6Z5_9PEZI|nr:hypothetical protein GTA08_BOTSDO13140 [Botryosphaeria dothidea]
MRFKNVLNSSPTAASGVTNTIDSASGYCLPSHTAHLTPTSLHRRVISSRNDFNGTTTTTVVPSGSAHAGNINNTLLPAPVGITATTGLCPALITSIAGFCTLRNIASLPTNCFNCSSAFIFLNRI